MFYISLITKHTVKRSAIFLLIAVSAVAISATIAFMLYQEYNTHPFYLSSLSTPCPTYLFSYSPVAVGNFTNITPLGNVDPASGHVLPTDHLYFWLPVSGTNSNFSKMVPVYSPGNVTINSIVVGTYYNSAGNGVEKDYSVYFSVCKDIAGFFNHVLNLSLGLQSQVSHAGGSCDQRYSVNIGSITSVQRCTYNLNYGVSAGSLIGSAGGVELSLAGGMAMDFGLYDSNANLSFINPRRYYAGYSYAVCPLDYYTPSMKSTLYAYLTDASTNYSSFPACGEIAQDKAGTIIGNWFYGSSTTDNPNGWAKELSVLHYNYNPEMYVIDWGGTISYANTLYFYPQNNGTINLNPNLVTPGSGVYCYQSGNSNQSFYNYGNYILLSFVNTNTLDVQSGTGSCPSNPTLSNAFTYNR